MTKANQANGVHFPSNSWQRQSPSSAATHGAEDFSFYQEKVPGLFFFLGIIPPGGKIIPNHSPHFYIDESALVIGVQALSNLAVDYLES